MEVDQDDVFFQELSRRVSLLIMDDDEVLDTTYQSVSLQDFSRTTIGPSPTAQSPYLYEQQTTCCSRESKGTGVFIPQSTHWRRKNRHSKFNSKSHHNKQPQNTKGSVSHVPYNNNPLYSLNTPRKS